MFTKLCLLSKRELGSYFSTWSAYIIAAATLLLDGLLFNSFAVGRDAKYSADVLSDFFYFTSGISIVSGILLAMRLISEEKQTGTLLLLFTSPITDVLIIALGAHVGGAAWRWYRRLRDDHAPNSAEGAKR